MMKAFNWELSVAITHTSMQLDATQVVSDSGDKYWFGVLIQFTIDVVSNLGRKVQKVHSACISRRGGQVVCHFALVVDVR
jgi:hypothetical protein